MRNWKRKTRYAKKNLQRNLFKQRAKWFQSILAESETEFAKIRAQTNQASSSVIFDLERRKDDPYIMRIESLTVDGIDRSDILERCYVKG